MTSAVKLSALAALSPGVPDLLADAAPRVLVVGDVILDAWWHGHVERLCREAPAPVVDVRTRDEAPGGAGNTALNAARLGARVRLLATTGTDAAGDRVRALLTEGGVDCTGLVRVDGTTTTKSRIIAGDQILARIDDRATAPAPGELATLAAAVADAVDEADAVIICDYRLGTLEGPVAAALVDSLAMRPPPDAGGPLVVVDAHDSGRWRGLRPDVATPNAAEAIGLLGGGSPGDRVEWIRGQRRRLLRRTGARCVVVTLDRDGTLALPGPSFGLGSEVPPGASTPVPILEHRTWARPAGERQASGAGDTYVACLTVGLAAGLDAPVALNLAQAAADVVVHRPGTSVCTTADLRQHLGGLAGAVWSGAELAPVIAAHRSAGHRVVLTNGCFDVLHRGHTRYLEQARQLGDVLVVGVNDDDSVRRLKGPDRPINPLADRAAVLAALSCVDHVVSFASDSAVPLIEQLRPDVYAKGGDYAPEDLPEAPAVEACGGVVVILDFVPDRSTTEVVRRIRAGGPPPPATGDAERKPA